MSLLHPHQQDLFRVITTSGHKQIVGDARTRDEAILMFTMAVGSGAYAFDDCGIKVLSDVEYQRVTGGAR